ncbi:hypothetical protein ASPWEDRAFT_38788 [Aspergillus wentii DTO 134E9]|uniref:Uncharacterized protein n=1 Tax=Aspergillus wentii DTO 134E9 TaxID=1073089 RepID=A0A1L9RQ98_ASPWE|nr:uncharacterized protein ASPWEDRAFT_38788 [Aspergillus wentii DTO 134E9]OJJ37135.1 hypothetical protein ASPWEDRAFT_38788 [Aspergillus wentii DTO 134E9]
MEEEEEEEEPADASDSNAAAAVSDARAGTAEGTKPPRKRSKRGRKPNKERDESVEEIDSDAAPVPGADSAAARPRATALGAQAFPPFPTDSLKGAAQLSMHTVLSRQLQERLEDCETKWLAAIESLQTAKETLDSWVEVWRKGL